MMLNPDQRALFVCEKRSHADAVHGVWTSLHPHTPFVALIGDHFAGLHPRLPRDLPIGGPIVVAEPQYDTATALRVLSSAPGEALRESTDSGPDLLREADVIICATDFDDRGAFAFHNLVSHFAPGGVDRAFPRLQLRSLEPAEIEKSLSEPASTGDEVFLKMVSRAQARRFFDANWAMQAIPVFGSVLGRLGVPQEHRFVSKHALQLLFHLRDEDHPLSEGELVGAMLNWTGTGHYQDDGFKGMGSHSSRGRIVDRLEAAGLTERVPDPRREGRTALLISSLARAFLDLVHPGSRDPDLPFRLQLWAEAWPDSRPAMEKYLKSVFGRQRRFQALRTP